MKKWKLIDEWGGVAFKGTTRQCARFLEEDTKEFTNAAWYSSKKGFRHKEYLIVEEKEDEK